MATPRARVKFRSLHLQTAFDLALKFSVEERLRFVTVRESAAYRDLYLAGVERLRLDKASGRIIHETLKVDSSQGYAWHFSAKDQGYLTSVRLSAPTATAMANRMATALLDAALAIVPRSLGEAPSHKVQNKARYILFKRLYGHKFSPAIEARRYFKVLWHELLDPERAKLALAVFGYNFTLNDYNRLIEEAPLVRQVQHETPNLLPLLGWCLRPLRPDENVQKLVVLNHGEPEPLPLKAVCTLSPRERFFGLRKLLKSGEGYEFPLSDAGWRFMAKSSALVVRSIAAWGYLYDSRMTYRVNALAAIWEKEMPVFFAKKVWGSHLSLLRPPSDPYFDRHQRFLRLAGRAAAKARKTGRLKRFLQDDFDFTYDYLSREGFNHGLPSATSTWESLMRRQAEWHAHIAQQQANRRSAEHWESLVAMLTVDDIVVTPLTNGQALYEEGRVMHHCVGGYVSSCASGKSRIFALRGPSEKLKSTLELTVDDLGHWRIAQHRGPCNAQIPERLARVGEKVAAAYRLAAKKQATPLAEKLAA